MKRAAFCLRSLVLLAGAFGTWLSAHPQIPGVGLRGTITDDKGRFIPDASIVATSVATELSREVTSDTRGEYLFTNLTPGRYHLRIQAEGFRITEFENVRLEAGCTRALDVVLKTDGAITEEADVKEAPGLNLMCSHTGGQISADTIDSVPLNQRNLFELAFLFPGNRPSTSIDSSKANAQELSSAGQSGRGGNVSVDGADNNNDVVGGMLMNFPQDAIQEFHIATNGFTAESGRSASSTISIVTRSGTNDYHGSVFAYFRHKALQGLPGTTDRSEPVSSCHREQTGGSVGGPIEVERAWWSFTLENRNQDCSLQLGRRDLVSRRIVVTSSSAPLRDFMLNFRSDFRLPSLNKMYARYDFNRTAEVANGDLRRPLGSEANLQNPLNWLQSILYGWDWTRRQKSNKLIFHVNTFLSSIPTFPNDKPVTRPDFGLGNELRFPSLQDGPNYLIPQRTRFSRLQIRDTFEWNAGSHSVRFGADWQKQFSDTLIDLYGDGTINVSEDFATQDRNLDGAIDDLDLPVAASVRSMSQTRPPFIPDLDNTYVGVFIQDDWRVRTYLTLSLGLRYEVDSDAFGEGPAHQACPTPLNTPPTDPCLWLRNALGLKRSRGFKNFGPRFGFSWDPFQDGRSKIAAGYGIYFDRVGLRARLSELLLDGRNLTVDVFGESTCNGGGSCHRAGATFDPATPTIANPFVGANVPVPLGITIVDDDAAHPYVQQFNLNAERELAARWVLSVTGIHNFGQRFPIRRLLLDDTNAPVTVTDPLTGRTSHVARIEPSGKAWYDALFISLQKRPAQKKNWEYSFNVNYTLSKTFDYTNSDEFSFDFDQQVDVLLGTNNVRLEKGFAPTDERHRLVFYGGFGVPFHFTIAPIWTVSSSVPIDTFVPEINARLPLLPRNVLARQIRTGADLNASLQQWNSLPVCPGAFPCRAGGTLPLVHPGLRFGDGFNSLDVRVSKKFAWKDETHRLEIITDIFNVFNATNVRGFSTKNFSGFNNAITSPDFGRALRTAGGFLGSGGPRAFQLAMRYSF